MAWNGSGEKKVENVGGDGRTNLSSSSFNAKALIAGLVVVLVGAVAIWLFSGKEKHLAPKNNRPTTSTKIAEILPTQPVKVEVETDNDNDTDATPTERPPQKIGEIRDGKILLPGGKLETVKGVVTSNVAHVNLKCHIFSHPCENIIASILSVQPGQTMVGTPHYNGRFTESFLKSLKEPIIVTKDDSEEDAALKRLVTQAKIELKAAYDRGEDIEEILLESRKECQRLASYKQELKKMTMQGIKECRTAEEVDDYVQAANKMLESKGIAPLENLGPIAKLKLQMNETEEAK